MPQSAFDEPADDQSPSAEPLSNSVSSHPPSQLSEPAPGSAVTGTEYGPEETVEAEPVTHGPVNTQPIDYASAVPVAASGGWTVGTLTYSVGGLVALFALLLAGDFAFSLRERSIGPVVQLMIKRLEASDLTMAILLSSLPTALSLIILPIVSYKSDRHRGRWGRRIPFLLIPTPFAALAIVCIAYSEDLGVWLSHMTPAMSAATWGLISLSLSWTFFECAILVANPMLGGLINDVVPRPVLGRFYGLFRAVSLFAGMIFNWYILKHADVHYHAILIGIALAFLAGFTFMCLTVREGQYPPPAPLPAGQPWWGIWTTSIKYLRSCFRISYYRWVFAGFALTALTFQPVNLFSLPYATSLEMSLAVFGKLLTLTYFASLILAWPLGWLVDRLHPLRVSMGTLAIYMISMFIAGVVVRDPTTFGIFFVIHGVLSGSFFTTSAPLGQMLFPRLTFAKYAAAASLVQSIVTLGFGPALGKVLDLSHHNYNLTFLIGAGLATMGLLTLVVVNGHFQRLGGRSDYIAPDEDIDEDGNEVARPKGFEVVTRGH